MYKKIILLFSPIFFLLFLQNKVSSAEGTVVVINQIRGDEVCCQPGNLDLINAVKNKINIKEIPIGWALRFDVLKNKIFLDNLSDLGEFGLLLEVTPNLAKESGVVYKGREDGSDWYFAKNAFLVGYTPEERKKIIDTLFNDFKKEFGYYPSFTVSWMIDAWSLSYIDKTYNIKLHEITREQYETDSYTLYGGIFNQPYYPSKDHPMIPADSPKNKLNLIIVRQTISDLIQNYGSQKAYFTSQPNDYLTSPDKLNFSYFKSLLDNTINQKSGNNFALLGFENSFSWEKYGNEYIKQLELVNEYQKEGKIKLFKPSDFYYEYVRNYSENKPFYFKKSFSTNSESGVLWYFGKSYRARIIIRDKKIILDDLRSFIATDPYKDDPATSDYAYWIVPYLIDGSQQYILSSTQEKIVKKDGLEYGTTLSDIYSNPFGLVFGEDKFIVNENPETIEIKLVGNKDGSVIFNPENITFDADLDTYFNWQKRINLKDLLSEGREQRFSFNKSFEMLLKNSNDSLDLGWLSNNKFIPLFEIKKQNNEFILSPKKQIDNLELLSPIFQPDKAHLQIDSQKSIFYWNNKEAIVGRNPIRVFILPLNTLGRPTQISKIEVKSPDKDKLKIIFPEDYSYRVSPWFIDIFSDNPLETRLSILIDNTEIVKDVKIEFIADCRKKISVCLTSTPQIIKYTLAILNEQKNSLISEFTKIWK